MKISLGKGNKCVTIILRKCLCLTVWCNKIGYVNLRDRPLTDGLVILLINLLKSAVQFIQILHLANFLIVCGFIQVIVRFAFARRHDLLCPNALNHCALPFCLHFFIYRNSSRLHIAAMGSLFPFVHNGNGSRGLLHTFLY